MDFLFSLFFLTSLLESLPFQPNLSLTKMPKKTNASPENLTPKQIVAELNKYVVGQDDAKKAVAIALRNRLRRKQVENPMRDEIIPKISPIKAPFFIADIQAAISRPFIDIF